MILSIFSNVFASCIVFVLFIFILFLLRFIEKFSESKEHLEHYKLIFNQNVSYKNEIENLKKQIKKLETEIVILEMQNKKEMMKSE